MVARVASDGGFDQFYIADCFSVSQAHVSRK